MRAEIISINNGTLAGNKITMVRGDTLELTLRVLRDDDSPILLSLFEEDAHNSTNTRAPHDDFYHRLSIEFRAALKDGGDIPVIYRSTQFPQQVLYGSPDKLTVVLGHEATRGLPAPLSLNFDMQITEFVSEKGRRMSTVYTGMLQIERDFTTRYEVDLSDPDDSGLGTLPG